MWVLFKYFEQSFNFSAIYHYCRKNVVSSNTFDSWIKRSFSVNRLGNLKPKPEENAAWHVCSCHSQTLFLYDRNKTYKVLIILLPIMLHYKFYVKIINFITNVVEFLMLLNPSVVIWIQQHAELCNLNINYYFY